MSNTSCFSQSKSSTHCRTCNKVGFDRLGLNFRLKFGFPSSKLKIYIVAVKNAD